MQIKKIISRDILSQKNYEFEFLHRGEVALRINKQ